jgi:hypothetical protein
MPCTQRLTHSSSSFFRSTCRNIIVTYLRHNFASGNLQRQREEHAKREKKTT